jgi:Protein of unknown function (DUF2511)
MSPFRRLTWLLVVLCSFTACAESGMLVTRQELGDRWPLTVDGGRVNCNQGALVFAHDGTIYALRSRSGKRVSSISIQQSSYT